MVCIPETKQWFNILKLNYGKKALDEIQQIIIIIAFSKLRRECLQSVHFEQQKFGQNSTNIHDNSF